MPWSQVARLGLGLAISALCLWLAFRSVPLGDLVTIIGGADARLLALSAIAQLTAVGARSRRWQGLVGPPVRLLDAVWAQAVGYLFTNLLPLRAGEAARVVALSSRSGVSFARVAGTAVLERLLDVGTMVCLLLLILPFVAVPSVVLRAGLLLGLASLVGAVGLIAFFRSPSARDRVVGWIQARATSPRLATIATLVRDLGRGLRPLAGSRTAIPAGFWSVVTWTCSVGSYWLTILAFQPDGTLIEASFAVVTLAFAISVPSSPGFIGVFQYIGQQALVTPFGAKYDPANALAIAFTQHLIYFVVTTVIGVIGLWQMGESFGHLWRRLGDLGRTRESTDDKRP